MKKLKGLAVLTFIEAKPLTDKQVKLISKLGNKFPEVFNTVKNMKILEIIKFCKRIK